MEELLLQDIEKKIVAVMLDFHGGLADLAGVMSLVKEYGEFKYDQGIEWANDQAYYSGDEA